MKAIPWYDPQTKMWLTYTGEFKSREDALKSISQSHNSGETK